MWRGLYAGSKAAVTAISETLRLELAPFGVKVVTVQAGAVGTNILAAGAQFELPHTSRYRGIEKEIAARAKGEDGVPKMESSVFAEKIVGDVLGGANWPVWRGKYASMVRLVAWWLPVFVIVSGFGVHGIENQELMFDQDSMLVKGTGLDVMKV